MMCKVKEQKNIFMNENAAIVVRAVLEHETGAASEIANNLDPIVGRQTAYVVMDRLRKQNLIYKIDDTYRSTKYMVADIGERMLKIWEETHNMGCRYYG